MSLNAKTDLTFLDPKLVSYDVKRNFVKLMGVNSNERWKDKNNFLMFNVENQKPGARSHPSAGPQVSSRLPGPQLSVSWLRNSPVRPTGGLQVLLLPGPEVGGAAGHLRQGVLPPGQPHHRPGPARLRPPLPGGLVLEHRLGRHHHQHRQSADTLSAGFFH